MSPAIDRDRRDRPGLVRTVGRPVELPASSLRWIPYEPRPCFLCGSLAACKHREPELLVLAREDSDEYQ